jgi:hypothetical protein
LPFTWALLLLWTQLKPIHILISIAFVFIGHQVVAIAGYHFGARARMT